MLFLLCSWKLCFLHKLFDNTCKCVRRRHIS